ncbi:hypothetical protein AA103193_2349 [Tanticharoenia sakaeratensis NBRC 103193]|nr:hypothetical protein AA103193_2349 [Tanticharoenia sakaeratensis NBRC 103193]
MVPDDITDGEYYGAVLTPEQIEAKIAEAVKAEREALRVAEAALASVVDGHSSQYRARNGRWVTLQSEDGERCDFIHSDITTECEGALDRVRSAIRARGDTP